MNSTALNCDPVGMELSYDDEGKVAYPLVEKVLLVVG